MNRIAIIFSLLAISTTVFAHPENYVMDCGNHKGIYLFVGHAVNPIMVMDKKNYIAIQDIGKANTDEFTFGEMAKDLNESGQYDKVFVNGAVTLSTIGDGIKRQINLIDAKANNPCTVTSYNENAIKGD